MLFTEHLQRLATHHSNFRIECYTEMWRLKYNKKCDKNSRSNFACFNILNGNVFAVSFGIQKVRSCKNFWYCNKSWRCTNNKPPKTFFYETVILNNNYVVTRTDIFKWVFIICEVEPIVSFIHKKWFIRFKRAQKNIYSINFSLFFIRKRISLKWFSAKNKNKIRLRTCFDTIA